MDRLRELAQETDPLLRLRAAEALRSLLKEEMAQCLLIRQQAAQELVNAGWTQEEVGDAVGVGRSRISQLVNPVAAPAERAFLGSGGTITVALGRKPSTAQPEEHPIYVRLQKLARSLKLRARVEDIPQDGAFQIRNQMIVACGPRRAPAVADILRWDPRIGFEQDAKGWHLVDRQNQVDYRSPIDSRRPADFAYIGRLPCRLDGKGGTFMCLAGIHEAGSLGAAHYLERHLEELYARFGTGHFSMLIYCEFDPHTGEVVLSREATPEDAQQDA